MKNLSTLINELNTKFWTRVNDSVSLPLESLCCFRIILGFYLLLIQLKTYSWIRYIPDLLYSPPKMSIARFFHSFPDYWLFLAIDMGILIAVLCIIFGIKARLASLLFGVLNIVGCSFNYSFGKIDHDILLYVLLICMSLSNWGTLLAFYPDKKLKGADRSLLLLSVLICFGMFTAGLPKARTWINLDMSSSGFLSWYFRGLSESGRSDLLMPYVLDFPPLLIKSFDFIAVLFELSAFFMLMAGRKFWKLWLLGVVTFHLLNCLLLNIPFVVNFLVYLAFIDFSGLYQRINNYIRQPYVKIILSSVVFLLVLIRLFFILTGNKNNNLLIDTEWDLNFAVLLWVVSIILFIKNIFQNPLSRMETTHTVNATSGRG
ncbi:hypothetical protein [Arcticibacter eurypsychrophilus]|uniref:hypothetical protein n=1 Tax=Arcticibacter eurypsychrophilus TaxID=1434752 RepID=UPI001112DBF2|nr:hypothetical protein [Arcticibacter eurypsychrophilus]